MEQKFDGGRRGCLRSCLGALLALRQFKIDLSCAVASIKIGGKSSNGN